jgi:hypothetical protein
MKQKPETGEKPMPTRCVVDPRVWHIWTLNDMVTECRSLAQPSADGPWFEFSPDQMAMLLRLVKMIGETIPTKAQLLETPRFPDTGCLSMN